MPRTEAEWKRWFENREGKRKIKSRKKARSRKGAGGADYEVSMSDVVLPRLVYESGSFAVSPRPGKIQKYAARRRWNPTPAEEKLRRILNDLNGGVLRDRFRREHAILRKWIVDFYFHEIRLAIEVDGSFHRSKSQLNRDRRKDADCARSGITVLRITNREVFGDKEILIRKLREGWRKALDRKNRRIANGGRAIRGKPARKERG